MQRIRRWWPRAGTLLSPLTISLAYCLLSIAWILFSDRFAGLIPDRLVAQQVQSIKGTAFVLATTVLMFALISRYRGLLIRAIEERAEERKRRERVDRVLEGLQPADTPEASMRTIAEAMTQLPGVEVGAYLLADAGRLVAMSAHPRLPSSWQLARSIASAVDSRDILFDVSRVVTVRPGDDTPLAATLPVGGWTAVALTAVVHEGEVIGMLVAGGQQSPTAGYAHGVAELGRVAGAWLGPQASATRERERRRTDVLQHGSRLRAVFQPIVDLEDGRPVGYEALTRFEDGSPPTQRFAEAVALGIGSDLEEMAIRRALADLSGLAGDCWVSINVSASLLLENGRLGRLLGDVRRPVVVELTEQEAIADYGAIRDAVHRLGPNVSLAIDDIGEAFSGLRHLVELGPAYAKLDLALVRDIDADPARQALVAALHHYMLQTGAHLIAEGVESDAERNMLRALGIRFAQGFLFGRPVPIHHMLVEGREPPNLRQMSRKRQARSNAAVRSASVGRVRRGQP